MNKMSVVTKEGRDLSRALQRIRTCSRPPTIAAVIPCYGQAHLIDKAIKSVLEQDIGFDQVLVINDGSPDDLDSAIEPYLDAVTYLKQSNGGLASARNLGARSSTCDWLLFLDADDWILPGYWSRMKQEVISSPEIDVFVCDYKVGHYDGSEGAVFPIRLNNISDPLKEILQCNLGPPVSFLVRRSLLSSAGMFDVTLGACEDWDMWLRLAKAGAQFKVIHSPIVCYREAHESMSRDIYRMLDATASICRRHYSGSRIGIVLAQYRHCLYYVHLNFRTACHQMQSLSGIITCFQRYPWLPILVAVESIRRFWYHRHYSPKVLRKRLSLR